MPRLMCKSCFHAQLNSFSCSTQLLLLLIICNIYIQAKKVDLVKCMLHVISIGMAFEQFFFNLN